jgi:hypothetical protein
MQLLREKKLVDIIQQFYKKKKLLMTDFSPSKQYDTDYFLHCTIPD